MNKKTVGILLIGQTPRADLMAPLDRLAQAFDDLGPRQGAVLTYAPYVGLLLSDDPFDH